MSRPPIEVYRYRKRKNLSLDGTVAGIQFNKFRRQVNTQASLGAMDVARGVGRSHYLVVQRQMFDQQIQMMFDPFMMPGP